MAKHGQDLKRQPRPSVAVGLTSADRELLERIADLPGVPMPADEIASIIDEVRAERLRAPTHRR